MGTLKLNRSLLWLFSLLLFPAWAVAGAQPDIVAPTGSPPATAPHALPAEPEATPKALEHQLQSLPWEQFRAVVESEPHLKADVDAYGPLGWVYVQKKYRDYAWSRNIERLEPERRRQLAATIQAAIRYSLDGHSLAAPRATTGVIPQ